MRKLVFGIGINDADYVVKSVVDGKSVWCPFYRSWLGMLRRAYGGYESKKYASYCGVTVCKEWIEFSKFKAWMEDQNWQGKTLDKDIIKSGNKIYSPELCAFVDTATNSLLTDCAAYRGSAPLGVSFYSRDGNYTAKIRVNGKLKHLGYFLDPLTAHTAWQKAKIERINDAASKQDDERVKHALLRRAKQLQDDIDNGVVTVKL